MLALLALVADVVIACQVGDPDPSPLALGPRPCVGFAPLPSPREAGDL